MTDDSFCDNQGVVMLTTLLEARLRTSTRQMTGILIFSGAVKSAKGRENESILVCMFRALTGSRCRTERRQVTGIPPTPVTLESTPTSHLKIKAASTQPTSGKMELDESMPEQLDPISVVEVIRQPSVDNQLGGSCIMEMQVQNDSCQVSICSLDSGAQGYLKNHFNEHLNYKIYNMFKELFGSINVDSIKEALPKVSIYNNTIARFVDEINSKYMAWL